MPFLPLVVSLDKEVAAQPKPGPTQGERVLTGLSILVVDDELTLLRLHELVLSRQGAEVTTASSASEALEKFHQVRPDVIVSDIGMPVTSGYELMESIREAERSLSVRTPALALTAFVGPEYNDLALAHGFDLYAGKPLEPHSLIELVLYLSKRNLA